VRDTLGAVSATPDVPVTDVLALAVEAASLAQAARATERETLADRDGAIVAAVRAGASLTEIASAAGITKAAASLAARRTLAPRPAAGGPYSRRRGVTAALAEVARLADNLDRARRASQEALHGRDAAIAAAVRAGAGVSATATAVQMTPASVSMIAKAGRGRESASLTQGAIASSQRCE
jgi:hypothetical protein